MTQLRLLRGGLLFATLLLSCELPVISSTAGKTSPPPESSPTLPGEGASLTYVSSLADTELVSVTNTGANAKDLLLYAGLYSSTASERVVKKSWPIPANGAAVTIKAADIDHLNLWILPTGGSLSRLTASGTLCVMKPTPGNQWALAFDGTSPSYYSWNMTGTDKTLGYDWTLPGISDDRTVSTAHLERGGLVSGPAVRLINSPHWQLDDDGAHLVNQGLSFGSNYYYGAIRLKYTGTTPLYFVKVTLRLRNADNSKRFFDYTYNCGTTVKASTYETSTAVLANGELARFALIDDLADYGMSFADVTAIDLFVDASPLAAGFSQPAGLTIGAPVWTDATSGYTPITNNNPGPLTSYMGEVFFADSQNLEYYFDFPSVYVQDKVTLEWNYWSSPYTLPSGDKARLTFGVNTSTVSSETFSVARMTQEWSGRSLMAGVGRATASSPSDAYHQALHVEDELRSRILREEVTAAAVAPRPRTLEDADSIGHRP